MLEYYPINFRLFKPQQTRHVDVALFLQIIIREIFLPEPHRKTLHSLTEISCSSLQEHVGTPPYLNQNHFLQNYFPFIMHNSN
jgi:hypothetical protein